MRTVLRSGDKLRQIKVVLTAGFSLSRITSGSEG